MNRLRAAHPPALLALLLPLLAAGAARGATSTFTSALIAPTASVMTGASTTVGVQVKCTGGSLANGVVDVEIYNASGAREMQFYWTAQSLATAQAKNYAFAWSRNKAGPVTVKVGVYGLGWTPLYHWNNAAGTITFTAPTSVPAAPTGLTAAPGNGQVALSWKASTGAASYKLKRSTTSGTGFAAIATPGATSYANTGLTNGTTYYYVVSAVNAKGESANSAQVSARPPAPVPPRPTGVTATPGDGQVALTWNAGSGASTYKVKRTTTSGTGFAVIATPTTPSYTNTGLTNGTAYYYVISAVNAQGESVNSVQVSATPSASSSPPVPSGLPGFLGLGLANDPGHMSWMTASNVPWSYRYQYLVGGVNTGTSWTTWNSPSGQFATYYMDDSRAHSYIPVFTYYQLVASNPNPYSESLDPKLQNSSTMNAYFAEWKLLMQKCGAFGGRVIVHVEPDGWGFMQHTHGDNPASTPVSVASSGFAEAAGLPNNASGFAKALVKLRDTYAPNALLAWHASAWATGTDLILNAADPNTVGARTAAFFNGLGANFDLIFYDPSDRDSGFYQYVYGDGGAHWWNDTAFTRYRQWIAKMTQATGRRGMLWQVPVGNTLYRTCNNTDGHYQDNRPQYFLQSGNHQHLVDYAVAGVIGILFGRGAGGPTDYMDSKGDGVTNPAAINGNSLPASYPDDDGGFLRVNSATYYQSGKVTLP